MACNEEEMRSDEEDQRIRSTKKIKMNEEDKDFSDKDIGDKEQNTVKLSEIDVENKNASIIKKNKQEDATSYKNKLLGINGNETSDSSDEPKIWSGDEESDEELQDMDESQLDPLCPSIPVSTEERMKLCKPWRKAVIIKLLGRKIGYKFLIGRSSRLWSLVGAFELIDLHNDFFLVRLHDPTDYERVMYEGPWMLLGHYLTIQRWKPEFRSLEKSIKRIVAWTEFWISQ